VDGGVVEGDTVTIFYDPMIAKIIAWDLDRPRALARLRGALAECEIVGPKSNIAFLEALVRHPVVVNASIDTSYLDKHLDEVLPTDPQPPPLEELAAAAAACLLHDEAADRAPRARLADPHSPWAIADGWRLGHAGQQKLGLRLARYAHRRVRARRRRQLHDRGGGECMPVRACLAPPMPSAAKSTATRCATSARRRAPRVAARRRDAAVAVAPAGVPGQRGDAGSKAIACWRRCPGASC
jgi:3-methylcrotonyl-CoA carboxylase alpha subunit